MRLARVSVHQHHDVIAHLRELVNLWREGQYREETVSTGTSVETHNSTKYGIDFFGLHHRQYRSRPDLYVIVFT